MTKSTKGTPNLANPKRRVVIGGILTELFLNNRMIPLCCDPSCRLSLRRIHNSSAKSRRGLVERGSHRIAMTQLLSQLILVVAEGADPERNLSCGSCGVFRRILQDF